MHAKLCNASCMLAILQTDGFIIIIIIIYPCLYFEFCRIFLDLLGYIFHAQRVNSTAIKLREWVCYWKNEPNLNRVTIVCDGYGGEEDFIDLIVSLRYFKRKNQRQVFLAPLCIERPKFMLQKEDWLNKSSYKHIQTICYLLMDNWRVRHGIKSQLWWYAMPL